MNNEALDKAVVELSGKLPEFKNEKYAMAKDALYMPFVKESFICTADQFTQRAKELGFINCYRWGVEYPTNGKRPDLADDVEIEILNNCGSRVNKPMKSFGGEIGWSIEGRMGDIISFKITDARYKPQDTSYLKTPAVEPVEDVGYGDWYDYENDVAVDLPPIGIRCFAKHQEGSWDQCYIVAKHVQIGCVIYSYSKTSGTLKYGLTSDQFRPLDHATRKVELEKKRVIDAAMAVVMNRQQGNAIEALYDAGYLRLPDNKD